MFMTLYGCGGGSSPPASFTAEFLSDPAYDGDIEQTGASFIITQGMSQTVQSVFFGIDPVTDAEMRAFLDFQIRGAGGIPQNAIIGSAFLDIFITGISPAFANVPVRIELVNFQPPTLLSTDFSRTILLPLNFTTIIPPLSPADVGRHVLVDVTSLMVTAQNLGLIDFQVRIMADLGFASVGLVEINDTIGPDCPLFAPLLQVTYF